MLNREHTQNPYAKANLIFSGIITAGDGCPSQYPKFLPPWSGQAKLLRPGTTYWLRRRLEKR